MNAIYMMAFIIRSVYMQVGDKYKFLFLAQYRTYNTEFIHIINIFIEYGDYSLKIRSILNAYYIRIVLFKGYLQPIHTYQ